jgi:hypothetical protein
MRGSSVCMLTVPVVPMKFDMFVKLQTCSFCTASAPENAAGSPQVLTGVVDRAKCKSHP